MVIHDSKAMVSWLSPQKGKNANIRGNKLFLWNYFIRVVLLFCIESPGVQREGVQGAD